VAGKLHRDRRQLESQESPVGKLPLQVQEIPAVAAPDLDDEAAGWDERLHLALDLFDQKPAAVSRSSPDDAIVHQNEI
jgi:hypothetical protein